MKNIQERKPLNKYESIDLLNQNGYSNRTLKKSLFKGITFYENSEIQDFIYINPKISTRISKTQTQYGNAYNEIIDNLDSWSKYAKRKHSIIATANEQTARAYGKVYALFPLKHKTIYICPESDVWYSFKSIYYKLGIASLNRNLIDINIILNDCYSTLYKKELKINSWEQVVELFNVFDKRELIISELSQDISKSFLKKIYSIETCSYDFFNQIFDPINFNFMISDIFSYTLYGNKEVWTDSDCLLINSDIIENLQL